MYYKNKSKHLPIQYVNENYPLLYVTHLLVEHSLLKCYKMMLKYFLTHVIVDKYVFDCWL